MKTSSNRFALSIFYELGHETKISLDDADDDVQADLEPPSLCSHSFVRWIRKEIGPGVLAERCLMRKVMGH